MVCAVEEIEKSTLFWGEGGKCDQDAQKFNFTIKCLNTFSPIVARRGEEKKQYPCFFLFVCFDLVFFGHHGRRAGVKIMVSCSAQG